VAALPDGTFSNQKFQFGYILEGLEVENVYFMAIWYILWPFGIFHGHLVYFIAILYILEPFGNLFFTVWYIVARKIWQP
jgi:hypothetical protein